MKSKVALGSALVLLLTVFSISSTSSVAAQTSTVALAGDGSTFAYPMYSKWIEEYEKANPGVQITSVSNGSGAGIHDIMMGNVDFAGTDGPLNKTQMLDFSTHRLCDVLHFPTAIGADVPIYNLPGVTAALNFTPQALAGIFLGTITKWNDPQIAKPNPTVSLPDKAIVVVHRQDGSGTTYVWTDYLSKVSSDWNQRVGHGISVIWPTGIAAEGNAGVSKTVGSTPYSVGYSELTYALHNQLTYGNVLNRNGHFVKADLASVNAAAVSASDRIPDDFRVSITDAPGDGAYPISTFTWILVPSVISDPAKSTALVKFLQWGLADGQNYLEPLAYARLPNELVLRERQGLTRIKTVD
ncbi:MAG TPA: phosphate ABC transporter substrate-binding protein PstS [Candidatus Binataceae bacterium]|nr:phosphate ABC transporter substrate-binding protein PstS [Candidatus Binataceae bacterium]